MTRFIIFAALFGLQWFTVFSGDIKELSFGLGERARIDIPRDNVKECILKANNGSEYSYNENIDPIPGKVVKTIFNSYYPCSFEITNFDENDVGYWTVTVRDSEKETVYNYKLYLMTATKSEITVYEGHYVYLGVEDDLLDHLTSCKIVDPSKNIMDLMKETLENVEPAGKCGATIKANARSKGEWLLKAVSNEFILIQTSLQMRVTADKSENYEKKTVYVARGKDETIEVGPGDTRFCQLLDPKGVLLPLQFGKCAHKMSPVTTYHDGLWTARYGLMGRMETIEIKFNVSTYEVQKTYSEVKMESSGMLRLAYYFTTSSFKSCRFVRPDGKIIHFVLGAANDEYISYGNATFAYATVHMFCGLKIREPKEYDYGAWKFDVLRESYSDDTHIGTILRVDESGLSDSPRKSDDAFAVKTSAKNTIVREGDPFQIKCNADAVLKYCWLLSPNGTAYSVGQKDKNSKKSDILTYSGPGLSYGDCTADLPNASGSDQGQWTCVMGLSDGSDVEETISVVVTDTFLIAEEDKIAIPTDKPFSVTMNCFLHPYVESMDIDHCRWVRPDGHGISSSLLNKQYVVKSDRTYCSLSIVDFKPEEDIGRWTCAAGLIGSRTEEAWARIHLITSQESVERSDNILIGSLTGISLFLVMAGTIFGIVALRRRRQLPPKYPPAYSNESYLPTISQDKVFQAQAGGH